MNLLIVSATPFEIAPLIDYLGQQFIPVEEQVYQKGPLQVEVLITGVGLINTAFQLGKTLQKKEYNLAINVGIAGAINRDLKIGQVVQVISEQYGDLGVEEADGQFTSIHQLGLIEPDMPPFEKGYLINHAASQFDFLPAVKAISVNKVHGNSSSIEQLQKQFDADLESMEGAAFFQACLIEQIPFLQVRSVSNYVESRNRDNWDIPGAIEALNEVLIQLLKSL